MTKLTGRAIIHVDSVFLPEEHDDSRPLTDGWEIHVRCKNGSVDVFYAVKSGEGWFLKHVGGDMWQVPDLGDAFIRALNPDWG